jgi:hypothetical protein
MKEDIIRMAREAGCIPVRHPEYDNDVQVFATPDVLERFAALVAAAERNKVAQWMIDHSYATGHGDTTEDLLEELDWQITESWSKVVMASVEAEREACAKVCDEFESDTDPDAGAVLAAAIRARGQE